MSGNRSAGCQRQSTGTDNNSHSVWFWPGRRGQGLVRAVAWLCIQAHITQYSPQQPANDYDLSVMNTPDSLPSSLIIAKTILLLRFALCADN